MVKLDAVKKGLEFRLDELVRETREIDSELREPMDDDSSERAVELEDDEVLEERGNTALEGIAQIRNALIRIEAGTYGICTTCGGQISKARLIALPHTPSCIHCAD